MLGSPPFMEINTKGLRPQALTDLASWFVGGFKIEGARMDYNKNQADGN